MRRAESGNAQRQGCAALSAIFLSAAVTALAARPAAADQAALKARVEARLNEAKLSQQGDIQVTARNGGVVLDGAVLTLDAQRRAEKLARKETKSVENRLRVLPEPRPEAAVQHAVEEAILGYAYYGVFDSVELAVSDGAVTLRGSVLQPYRKTEIESRVARVDGVREIRNEIRVQPVSLLDDRLRSQLYRAIYGDERFVRYRNWPNPPVRIIVENGRVTLTGYVNSPVERTLLEHIARGTSSFGVVNRVQVEGETPKESRRES